MTEDDLHKSIVDYLRLRNVLFFHVPNANRAPVQWRAKLKALGALAGVSDLVLVFSNEVVFCEIKTSTGRQSSAQEDFRDAVVERGHRYVVVRSIEDVETTLNGG